MMFQAKEEFLEVATALRMEDDFNFGLMEVTFEWARGMVSHTERNMLFY